MAVRGWEREEEGKRHCCCCCVLGGKSVCMLVCLRSFVHDARVEYRMI